MTLASSCTRGCFDPLRRAQRVPEGPGDRPGKYSAVENEGKGVNDGVSPRSRAGFSSRFLPRAIPSMLRDVKTTAPGFLVAMPNLRDPNFAETVVLMLEHNKDGAVGLVINRRFPGSPDVVCTGLGIRWSERTLGDIRLGGPVRTQAGCILHPPRWRFPDTQIVAPGIAVSTSRDALDALVGDPACPFRLLLGYAGWASGQLEREMTEGTWLVAPVTDEVIFRTAPEQMYDKALGLLGIARRDLVAVRTSVN